MRNISREEKKYLLNTYDYITLCHKLDKILHPDPHGGRDGYMVRSLYFDTVYDSDFFNKVEGLEKRRKIRLRIYDTESETALLEMKQKQDIYQLKRSLSISREDAVKISQADYSPLLKEGSPFALELYAIMQTEVYRPKAIVEYNRKAYIAKENNIRITFDSLLRSTESSYDIFSSDLNLNPVLGSATTIMEIKYNGFLLSYMKDLLSLADRETLSVSKYILARHHSYLTHI